MQGDKDKSRSELSTSSADAKRQELARLLIDEKLISAAQVQLAMADQEVAGMTFEEVLLARRWVDEATLERLAPWLKGEAKKSLADLGAPPSDDYEENLKQYRRIMERILGPGWD